MKPSKLKPFLELAFKNRMPVLIVSEPGAGKTDLVGQACDAIQNDLLTSHPAISDPTDYKGMPAILQAISDGEKGIGPRAEFLPFGDLNKLIEAQRPTIAFSDDVGQSPPAVQAALMQLYLARRINGHKVSDHVTFCAATNDTKHMAGVAGLLEPVKSRFSTIVKLEVDLDDWCIWALDHQMPHELIAFIRFQPKMLSDFKPTRELTNSPCPRTVANVGRWMNLGIREHEVIRGAAGEGFADALVAFLDLYSKLPNLDDIIMNPDSAPVPDELSHLFAVSCGLAAKASANNFERVCHYLKRMPKEFEVSTVCDASRTKAELKPTRAYIEWATRNGQFLS